MGVIKTYIPKRYRSKKLVNSSGSSGSTTVINSGSSEFSPSAFVDSDTFYSMFEYDAANDAIKAKKEFYSTAGITAYGTGTVGGGGGTGVTVYNGLDSTDISLALSANMGKQLNDIKLNSSAVSAWALASVKPVYAISEITGLSTAIAGKSDTTHRHTISEITDFAHVHQWSAIENKPTTFAPSAHPHTVSNISDFPASLPASDVYSWAKAATKPGYSWSEIGSKPSVFTPDTHDHYVADILNFPASLPASDVSAWAKAANKPSYVASEIGGLGASYRWLTDAYITTWNAKEPAITKGTTSHYFRGDMSLALFPTALPASDVYAWAKAANKPTYAFSEIGSQPTTLSGYGITDAAGLTAFNNHVADAVKHITSTERTNWNAANSSSHTHSNKSYIDVINQNLGTSYSPTFADLNLNLASTNKSVKTFIDTFNSMFELTDGTIKAKMNMYGLGEITAFSAGSGVSGLTLQGDMNANGKNITNLLSVSNQQSVITMGYGSISFNIKGDNILTISDKEVYANTSIEATGLSLSGTAQATEFKFGRYKFMEDTNGDLGIYNGTTKIATILKTRTNSNL